MPYSNDSWNPKPSPPPIQQPWATPYATPLQGAILTNEVIVDTCRILGRNLFAELKERPETADVVSVTVEAQHSLDKAVFRVEWPEGVAEYPLSSTYALGGSWALLRVSRQLYESVVYGRAISQPHLRLTEPYLTAVVDRARERILESTKRDPVWPEDADLPG